MARKRTSGTIGMRTAIACLAAVAVLGFALGGLVPWRDRLVPEGSAALGPNVDTPEMRRVVLQSHTGLATKWGSFAGAPRLVFFGYTFCPDICPLGLSNLAGAIDILDARGIPLDPVFISVDPRRDTPEVLKGYVDAFHNRLEGLTGREDRIRALATAFLAYYEVSAETKGEEYYLIDHTRFIYLVGEGGNLLGHDPESTPPGELADAVLADLRGRRGG